MNVEPTTPSRSTVSLVNSSLNAQECAQERVHTPHNTPQSLNDPILNLSKYTLKPDEELVLRKGLTFIPSTKFDIKSAENSVKDLNRKLKLRHFFETKRLKQGGNPDDSYKKVDKFKAPSTWVPNPNLTPKEIDNMTDNILNHLKDLPEKGTTDNLTRKERTALNNLSKNHSIVIKPADKGSSIVIQDKQNYIKEAERQLNNPQHYCKVQVCTLKETVQKTNKILRIMWGKCLITHKNLNFLKPPEGRRPRQFYLLPKIHKPRDKWTVPDLIPAGRPIISDIDSESYRIAQFLSDQLKPYANSHPSYLKDTYDFINKLNNLDPLPDNCILATLDVDSLYTNIDNTFGINSVKSALGRDPKPIHQYIIELLDLNLRTNDFEFNGEHYLQIFGTAMGKSYSVEYANIVMAEWERLALTNTTDQPLVYFRFLDDIFIIWTHGEEKFQTFLNFLNSQAPTIKLKACTSTQSVDFLDVTIFKGENFQNNGKLDTKVYFKETDSHQLLFKESFHPKHTFKAIIKSQIIRFYRICNNNEDFEEACKILFQALRDRRYSRRFLRTIKAATLIELNKKNPPNERGSGLSYPCKSRKCTICKHMIRTDHFVFQNRKFPIEHYMNCNSKNVIYLLGCDTCNQCYVGQTINFRERFLNHRSNIITKTDTAIGNHFNLPNHSVNDLCVVLIEQIEANQELKNTLDEREKFWISKLDTFKNGLNLEAGNSPDKLIPLVMKFSINSFSIQKKLQEEFVKLKQMEQFKTCRIIMAFQKNKNLKQTLVRAKMPNSDV